ncbi:MAG: hypothetical protein ISR75_02185 [Phycisphaerales bacterium]|nr:hypothetical protein [Planctomycetota bacterium]MBL6997231.1 hypothetical protein [Phycisphaerales bacterium]
MLTSLTVTLLLAFATENSQESWGSSSRFEQVPISIPTPKAMDVTFKSSQKGSQRANRGSCPQVNVSLTDSDFEPGAYTLQAGFAQGESLGATYAVAAEDFPIRIDVMETIFGTSNATVQTTTHWSATVWDGTPTNGIQVATFSSDGIILPHLVMGPGTNGTIISLSVDSNDPDQIYIYNDSGMNSFTVAFRIDQHNNPGIPCTTSPPTNSNAFPCTDTSGLQFPSLNWIDAVDGPWCVCGSGWMTFQQFPSFCTPSGDWVIRASYTSVNCTVEPAACCLSDNSCFDLSPSECELYGGSSQNAGTTCATYICGSGTGACCVESTGNCVDFDLATCQVVGGIHMGEGTDCSSTTCFPEGACCLADGACIGPVALADCDAVAGTFQGDGSSCASTNCPQPVGACCGSDWCLDLTESDCSAVAGGWQGMDSACSDTSICEAPCPEDFNGDGVINVSDLLEVVGGWATNDPLLDLDGSGTVDTADLLAVIAAWGDCG